MSTKHQALDVPSAGDESRREYASGIVERQGVGTSGAVGGLRLRTWMLRDAPTSSFSLTMIENGGVGAEFDFGQGRFVVGADDRTRRYVTIGAPDRHASRRAGCASNAPTSCSAIAAFDQ